MTSGCCTSRDARTYSPCRAPCARPAAWQSATATCCATGERERRRCARPPKVETPDFLQETFARKGDSRIPGEFHKQGKFTRFEFCIDAVDAHFASTFVDLHAAKPQDGAFGLLRKSVAPENRLHARDEFAR